jgi:hypothetical protein
MRNLLAFVAFVALAFAGAGWYLGWYTVQTTPSAKGPKVSIDIDGSKIKEDLHRGGKRLLHEGEELADSLKDDDKASAATGAKPAPK